MPKLRGNSRGKRVIATLEGRSDKPLSSDEIEAYLINAEHTSRHMQALIDGCSFNDEIDRKGTEETVAQTKEHIERSKKLLERD